jgi:hypothetical protein
MSTPIIVFTCLTKVQDCGVSDATLQKGLERLDEAAYLGFDASSGNFESLGLNHSIIVVHDSWPEINDRPQVKDSASHKIFNEVLRTAEQVLALHHRNPPQENLDLLKEHCSPKTSIRFIHGQHGIKLGFYQDVFRVLQKEDCSQAFEEIREILLGSPLLEFKLECLYWLLENNLTNMPDPIQLRRQYPPGKVHQLQRDRIFSEFLSTCESIRTGIERGMDTDFRHSQIVELRTKWLDRE